MLHGSRKSKSLLLVCLAWACAGRSSELSPSATRHADNSMGAALTPAASIAAVPAASASEPAALRQPTLLITDPSLLTALEARGLSLIRVLGATDDDSSNRALARLPRFAPVVETLEREAEQAKASDPLAGVEVARFSHRLFDRRFLRLAQARFALAGVVNRPDRAPFGVASCGETRLIYRLEYALDAEHASKLPMTLGVELQVPRPTAGCREAAARWLEPAHESVERRADWLRSDRGPLAPALTLLASNSAHVVVNLQLVRWPSTARPDLGGHAEYLLRSFKLDARGALAPEALENTIDPNRLRTPRLRAQLLKFLDENAASVDAGTVALPEAVLTTRALSVTPRGLHRLANRPFSSALNVKELAGLGFTPGAFVKSGAGLLRRLDELSCQGCHEARSVAGFHLLGEDRADSPAENALAVAVSPQVSADLARRLRVAEQMLANQEPDFSAPFAERGSAGGGYGRACGLGTDPTFAGWTCATGLACSPIENNAGDAVGQCLPSEHQVGDACEQGGVRQHGDRRRDGMASVAVDACPEMVCNRSGVGFPGGMCTAACGAAGASCGSIAILDSFNACLARGESFLTCIRGNVRPAGLRACSDVDPCRDDYVCARGARGGVCLPPYFVFQLRVDGHSTGSQR